MHGQQNIKFSTKRLEIQYRLPLRS
jgi:hypothetical protein